MARCSCGLSGTSGVTKFHDGDLVQLHLGPIDRQMSSRVLPPNGSVGRVRPISFGSSSRVSLPGPGGGLVYVQWYDAMGREAEHVGVTSRALAKLTQAEIQAWVRKFVRAKSGRGLGSMIKSEPKPKQIAIYGRRWFNSRVGNTYHSVSIAINGTDHGSSGIHYGDGNQYSQTAADLLEAHGFMPKREHHGSGNKETLHRYCARMGIAFSDDVIDVKRKKDL